MLTVSVTEVRVTSGHDFGVMITLLKWGDLSTVGGTIP